MPFLGWRMVGVAFVADFISVGFMFYSFGVFIHAIEADMGWTRSQVSWALAASNLASAVAAPLVGRTLDRIGVRRVMAAGCIVLAAGFALLGQVAALWQFLLIFGTLLAAGAQSTGHLTSAKLVANWFAARRGTALGIATMGISLSGLAMPPIATALIDSFGWRTSFHLYAAGTLALVLPLALFVVVNRPEDRGQRPDGEAPPAEHEAAPVPERTWRSGEMLRERGFWGAVLPFSIGFFANSAVLTHLVPHARHLGIDAYPAAALLSFVAGAGVVGKVVFGQVADRMGARTAVALSFALQLLGVVLLLVFEDWPRMVATGVVFGFGMGGMVPLQSTLVGETFGRVSFGKALGLMRPFQVPIHAMGIPFAGIVFERAGTYTFAFQVFVATYVLAIAMVVWLGRSRPAREPGHGHGRAG
ncbi:MAG: MFS transporter [Myxococcota bacterium]|nr:MFS transporter [Myxococcota bacterium]